MRLLFLLAGLALLNLMVRPATAEEFQIVVPKQSYVQKFPLDYRIPYLRKEIEAKAEKKRPGFSVDFHDGGLVTVGRDQAVSLLVDQSSDAEANLDFLATVPADRLRELVVVCFHLPKTELRKLRRFTGLTHLLIDVTEDGLGVDVDAVIENCPQLESFLLASRSLHGSKAEAFSDATIEKVQRLKNLKSLAVRGPNVTEQGLEQLRKLPKLEAFDLGSPNRISDQGLQTLAKIKTLREIVIELNPAMTRAGFKSLAGLPHLETLMIGKGDTIPAAELAEMKAALPGVTIRFE